MGGRHKVPPLRFRETVLHHRRYRTGLAFQPDLRVYGFSDVYLTGLNGGNRAVYPAPYNSLDQVSAISLAERRLGHRQTRSCCRYGSADHRYTPTMRNLVHHSSRKDRRHSSALGVVISISPSILIGSAQTRALQCHSAAVLFPNLRVAMHIDVVREFIGIEPQELKNIVKVRLWKFQSYRRASFSPSAGHLIVLDHSAGVADCPPKPKLCELHVVVNVVDLVVQAVEISEGAVRAAAFRQFEFKLILDVLVVLIHRPPEEIGEVERFYANLLDLFQRRVEVRVQIPFADLIINPIVRIVANLMFDDFRVVADLLVFFRQDAPAIFAFAVLGIETSGS